MEPASDVESRSGMEGLRTPFECGAARELSGLDGGGLVALDALLQHLIRQNPFGLVVVDDALCIIEASVGAERVLADGQPLAGRALDAVIAERMSPRLAARAAARLHQVIATGEPYRTPSDPPLEALDDGAFADGLSHTEADVRLSTDALEARRAFAFAFDLRIDRVALPGGRAGAACHFYDLSERRRLEASLRESEARFRSMADTLPLIVWVHDAQGRQVWVNDTFCSFFGIRREQLGEGGWTALTHPDDGPSYVQGFVEAVRTRSAFHGEVRVQDGQGRWRCLESWGQPRFASDGTFLGHVGTSADVTDRKATEQALVEARDWLQRQHAELELIYRTTPVGLCMVDQDLRYVRINDRLASINGRSVQDHIGRTVAEVVPEIADTVCALMRRVLTSGEPVVDQEIVAPATDDGVSARTYLVNYVPVRAAVGDRVAGVAAVVQETTVQRRMERALRDSERRFRGLAEAMPHGVWVSDDTGYNTYHNSTWFQYTGQDEAAALGTGWLEHCHLEDQAALLAAWEQARAAPATRPYDAEARFRRHDGEYRWFRVTGAPVLDDEGDVIRWVGTVSDIHEQRLLMLALRDADRRKDAFLATLAHELRNPLAAVTNAAMLLQRFDLPADQRSWASDVILRQSRQLGRLIDDLMDVSRVTIGRIELRRQPLDLCEVLRSAAETAGPAMRARRQHFSLVLPPAHRLPVDGDSARLGQLFQNLLSNASKYTRVGGSVTLLAEALPAEGWIEVRVHDEGVGLRAEDLPRIFEMFAQVADSRELSEGGLGIGLYLVRRLAQLHGGDVEARSPGPGQGSTFIVRLPSLSAPLMPIDGAHFSARDAQVEAQAEPRIGSPLASDGSLQGRRVLIADDNEDMLRSLTLLLSSAGCEVHAVADGRAAVQAVFEFRPELVLLDLGMPRMDGYEAAAVMRADPRGRDLCLVALTGWGQPEDRARSRAAGFDHHLVKPIDLQTLERLLTRPRNAPGP